MTETPKEWADRVKADLDALKPAGGRVLPEAAQQKQALPQGGRAVMSQRIDPRDSLDFFPTPPWATRALLDCVIRDACGIAWEPAAGAGHMAEVLRERFEVVHASDVFDYGRGYAVGSFVGAGPDRAAPPQRADWIVTNPPFNLALEFAERAIEDARRGVALLVRSTWAEGGARYARLFRDRPPAIVAQFAERVPMVKGRWDPKASTATGYAWFVWDRAASLAGPTAFFWIPPGCRQRLTRPDDVARFAGTNDETGNRGGRDAHV